MHFVVAWPIRLWVRGEGTSNDNFFSLKFSDELNNNFLAAHIQNAHEAHGESLETDQGTRLHPFQVKKGILLEADQGSLTCSLMCILQEHGSRVSTGLFLG